jgi:proteic killer suppression protein
VIHSFRCSETERIFNGATSRAFPPDIQATARRKLRMLDDAVSLADLRQLPGNRLEALKGDRAGQCSIRINDQWRICFRWDQGAHDVEIVDYHQNADRGEASAGFPPILHEETDERRKAPQHPSGGGAP